jgi:hypothetical protein
VTVACLALLLGGGAVLAQTVQIGPEADNSMWAEGDLSNGAGERMFSGVTNFGGTRRALIRFDVAGNVPAGATILGASLTLHVSKSPPGASPEVFSLYRLTSDWGEGTSNAGDPGGFGTAATLGDATWNEAFFGSVPWGTPGGDFAAAASAGQTIDSLGFYSWSSSGMQADAQAWLDNPATNFGWLIKNAETIAGSARRYDTRENADVSVRPVLTINYTTGDAPVPTVGEWGMILMTLLLLTAGTLAFGQRRPALAGPGGGMSFGLPRRMFVPALYARVLAAAVGLAVLGFVVAFLVQGTLSGVDLIGAAICTPVAAYLVHLWLRKS